MQECLSVFEDGMDCFLGFFCIVVGSLLVSAGDLISTSSFSFHSYVYGEEAFTCSQAFKSVNAKQAGSRDRLWVKSLL